MHIDAQCPQIHTVSSEKEFEEINKDKNGAFYILGGGSNVLFPDFFDSVILHNTIKGIELIDESGDDVILECGSGEIWHQLVRWTVERNLYGIENLSLIPGTVGAAPVQNIGAYGVEIKDVLMAVRYYDMRDEHWKWRDGSECKFAYRNSIFKEELKGNAFISRVRLRLSKLAIPVLSYGALKGMKARDVVPSSREISDAVINIRQSKLPDPDVLGNCGSFFHNPIVEKAFAEAIKANYPSMPSYPMGQGMVKIPAAWLIEKCGLKGKKYGEVGCYEKHALVIVNYGGATGKEVRTHVNRVQDQVQERFNIHLKPEVNIL